MNVSENMIANGEIILFVHIYMTNHLFIQDLVCYTYIYYHYMYFNKLYINVYPLEF